MVGLLAQAFPSYNLNRGRKLTREKNSSFFLFYARPDYRTRRHARKITFYRKLSRLQIN